MTRSMLMGAAVVLGWVFLASAQAFEPPDSPADSPPKDQQKLKLPDLAALQKTRGANNTYLARLHLLRGELDRFQDDRNWRNFLLQMIATEYSFIGRYQKAYESFDAGVGSNDGGTGTTPLPTFADYQPLNAVDTIVELADRHQVIMINEAHNVPLHRAFTLQLLESLYQKGFRYFAAETLTAKDPELQKRGYPTINTGFYTCEPIYADLVRTALRLGYQVVPYEHEPGMPQPVVDEDPFADEHLIEAQNAREHGQAKNLYERILRKDPRAKVLVHAGYAHISKKPDTWEMNGKKGEIRFMAVAFRELTGIEPLSIDQTSMTERSLSGRDSRIYRAAIEQGIVSDQAVVLRHRATSEWFTLSEVYDLMVIHPRSRYENGRPTWLALGGRRSPHAVGCDARPTSGESYLAQAFYKEEMGAEALPVDQMEYTADEPAPTLFLPRGEFCVRIIDQRGAAIEEYTTH